MKAGLGKNYREGIRMPELIRMFPSDEKAQQWFIDNRWPDGVICPHCDSQKITLKTTHPTMPFRCMTCRKYFSVLKTSNLSVLKNNHNKNIDKF